MQGNELKHEAPLITPPLHHPLPQHMHVLCICEVNVEETRAANASSARPSVLRPRTEAAFNKRETLLQKEQFRMTRP